MAMRNKTYRNVLKATKMIMAKGYSKEEANDIAISIFDGHIGDIHPIEWYIEKVAPKEEWLEDQRKYGYLFQGGPLSSPVSY